MNQQQQLSHVESINKLGIELMKSKGHDYAGVDVLKNFKQMHEACLLFGVDTTKIEGIHMFYILLKIQRLCNLIFSGKEGKNESIQDTLIDLRNYTDLLNCTFQERKLLAAPKEEYTGETKAFTKMFGLNDTRLVEYLREGYREGKTEFRIALQSDDHFIIHPMNEKGITLDYQY